MRLIYCAHDSNLLAADLIYHSKYFLENAMIKSKRKRTKMNELEKAKAVLVDKRISLKDLSKISGVGYQTMKNYRMNNTRLDRASWQTIHNMAQTYERLERDSAMSEKERDKFIQKLSELFDKWKTDAIKKHQKVATIEKMEELILNDPLAVAELDYF